MEIHHITPELVEFVSVPCDKCNYRYACWTSKDSCCPLKAVRLTKEWMGDNNLFGCYTTKVEINENLGKFNHRLLSKIAEDLEEAYGHQKRY